MYESIYASVIAVCALARRDSLSLFYSFSLFFSLPLFDSTLKLPSSISFYPYTGDFPRMRYRICRRHRTSTFRYDYAQAKPLSDVIAHRFWIPVFVRVLRGSTARLRNRELRSQQSNSGFVSWFLYIAITEV